MENPTDRVTYGDLRMIRAEFDELMQLSIEAGTIKHPIAYETYIDESFVRAHEAAHDSAVMRRFAHRRPVVSHRPRWPQRRNAAPQPTRSRPACSSPSCAAPELALQGSDGKPLDLARYRGKVVLLAFGFSHCGEVCPITLATLARRAQEAGRGRRRTCRWSTSRSIRSATTPRSMKQIPRQLRPDASSAASARAREIDAAQKSYGISLDEDRSTRTAATPSAIPRRST